MAIPPAVVAAGVGAAAGLAGTALDIRAQKKAASKLEDQRDNELNLIMGFGNAAIEAMTPGYQAGQDVRQTALDQTLALQGKTFMPQVEAVRRGDYMAQQAINASLIGQRNALLGDPVDYGAYQPQSVPVNYATELAGLVNPQSLNFQDIQMPDFRQGAELGLTPFNAAAYLQANPDVANYYKTNAKELVAGGDPLYATAEGFAKYHYDQSRLAGENRPLTIQEAQQRNQVATQQTTTAEATPANAVFNSEQVKNILSSMG